MLTQQWKKSSRSNPSGNCVESRWRRANRCEAQNCVEMRPSLDQTEVQIRDTKLGEASPVITVSGEEWIKLLNWIKGLTIMGPAAANLSFALTVAGSTEEPVTISIEKGGVKLTYTSDEWSAFYDGVQAGEFDLDVTEAAA